VIAGLLALVVAAAFTGAAVYILWAEQPARLGLDDRALLAQWQPSYSRGYTMQSSLAVAGFLLGVAAWWLTRDWSWLVGALAMILNWPWTLIVMKPVNGRLDAWALEDASAESRALIRKWATLHAIRAMLGGVAVLTFLWAASAQV
jgi:hypothetical protein